MVIEKKYFISNINGQIPLKCPSKFNDISEGKIVANVTKEQFVDLYCIEWLRFNNQISFENYHSLKKCAFKPVASTQLLMNRLNLIISNKSNIMDDASSAYDEMLKKLNAGSQFLVACFSKATPIDNDMMWGYYGNSHKGYCIEINLNKMRFIVGQHQESQFSQDDISVCKTFLNSLYFVKYTNKPVRANITKYIRRYIIDSTTLFASLDFLEEKKKLQFRALQQKKKCWSNENEIRLIVDSNHTNFNISPDKIITIPQSCITYVFAGNKSNRNIKESEKQFKERSLQEQSKNIFKHDSLSYTDDDLPI